MTLEIRAQEADVDNGCARLFTGLATSPCGYHLARVGRLAERQLSLDAFFELYADEAKLVAIEIDPQAVVFGDWEVEKRQITTQGTGSAVLHPG